VLIYAWRVVIAPYTSGLIAHVEEVGTKRRICSNVKVHDAVAIVKEHRAYLS
jgi:hypothetical protein